MRLCFIGDSFVNGTGDDTCLGWVGRICAAARQQGHDVTAYNLGVRRDTSTDIAARWRAEAAVRLPAGCDGRLVFSFGANDCCFGEDGKIRVPKTHSLANAQAILTAAKAVWPVLMIGPPPVRDNPSTDELIEILSAEFADLCAKLGVPYLEIFPALAACEAWQREAACGDGTHPDSKGYAALAELIGGWDAWRGWFTT